MGKRYRDYTEKEKELNVVLQQLVNYNYECSISNYMMNDINNKIEFFNNIRKLIDFIKKDYSMNVNVSLEDVVLYYMKDYYLLYSSQNKDNVCCYDLDGNNIWKANENVRFLWEDGENFAISVANECIDKFQSGGYIWRFMTYKDNKIRRIPGVTIEDVAEYKDLNDNLIELKFNNAKVSVFDKKTSQIIISNVDKIERICDNNGTFNKNNSFMITKKIFDDKHIDCQFYIDNYGYIISDLCDSKCCFSFILPDKYDKSKYNQNLEIIYQQISDIFQEKGIQLIKK